MKSSTTLIREIQIKITQIHFSPIRLAKIQTFDKFCSAAPRKQTSTLLHCWWECNWHNPYGGQFGNNLQKLQMHIPFDPAILLLGIYPTYLIAHMHNAICTILFTAALFVIAKD